MLNFKNLKIFYTTHTILENVSGHFYPREIVGIVGQNGVGKSSLLKTIAGLFPQYSGSIELLDTPLQNLSLKRLAMLRSFLGPYKICHWDLKAEDILMIPKLQKGTSEYAQEIREAFNITPLMEKSFCSLSSGEQSRILIVRSLLSVTPIIFLDEPTANLDMQYQFVLMEILKKEARKGRLIFIVLHNLNLAAEYCTRILLLEKGKIACDGPPDLVFRKETIHSCFNVHAHIIKTPQRKVSLVFSASKKH